MVLDYPAYPSWKDVEVALRSNGIFPTDGQLSQYGRKMADVTSRAAAAQFENLTGWGPTLAAREESDDDTGELVVETRYFDGGDHNGDLYLQGGLLRLDSVSLGGAVQTQNFTPCSHRYGRKPGAPIIAFRGAFYEWQGAGSYLGSSLTGYYGNRVAITGVWGRFLRVPADVWEVCLHKAVANMMDYVYNQQSIGSISMDGFSESFDITGVRTQQNIAETGAKGFNSLCLNYQMPYLG